MLQVHKLALTTTLPPTYKPILLVLSSIISVGNSNEYHRFSWRNKKTLNIFMLTFVKLNKLRCHAHFKLSANRIIWSRLLIKIYIQCKPDQLASEEANWSGSTLFAKAGHIRDQQDKEGLSIRSYAVYNWATTCQKGSSGPGLKKLVLWSYAVYSWATTCEKRSSGHIVTAKAQISLHIHPV